MSFQQSNINPWRRKGCYRELPECGVAALSVENQYNTTLRLASRCRVDRSRDGMVDQSKYKSLSKAAGSTTLRCCFRLEQ